MFDTPQVSLPDKVLLKFALLLSNAESVALKHPVIKTPDATEVALSEIMTEGKLWTTPHFRFRLPKNRNENEFSTFIVLITYASFTGAAL